MIRLTLILIALVGCRYSDTKGLGSGGGSSLEADNNTGSTDADGDDTAGPMGEAPIITSAEGTWDNESDPPRAEIIIAVTDFDDDLHNGKVGVSVNASANTWFIIQNPDMDDASDLIEAVWNPEVDEVIVTAEVDNGDAEIASIAIQVKDAASNMSEAYEVVFSN
jgi:hypothetical protein